ncbi:uncharacterized protein OCT59_024032 [Rhizophagus irregularis]|uniref:uncharacterized protein n=1 Tax=Rhizophagus irregularis TaxID=588596 RepID=UPI0019EE34DE|nr:hypothetical protein OCT59_024032 [Rhizophagus irregularis]GET58525.1 hypothetical protein RIR_jg14250.t1 [Rhizophagus irregularis DAOM 181602=DAOM 197198]
MQLTSLHHYLIIDTRRYVKRRSSNGQRSKRPSNGPSTPSTPIDEDALAALEGRRKEYGESPELELQA